MSKVICSYSVSSAYAVLYLSSGATTNQMCERGDIGKELADALVAEYDRRAENESLYGYQAFATAVARKPEKKP